MRVYIIYYKWLLHKPDFVWNVPYRTLFVYSAREQGIGMPVCPQLTVTQKPHTITTTAVQFNIEYCEIHRNGYAFGYL